MAGEVRHKLTMILHDYGNQKQLVARWFVERPPAVDLVMMDFATGDEQVIAYLLPETIVALGQAIGVGGVPLSD